MLLELILINVLNDEILNADREADERGEFINCFGEKMGKRKQ